MFAKINLATLGPTYMIRDGWPYKFNLKIHSFFGLIAQIYLKQSKRIYIKLVLATLGSSHMTNGPNILT